MANQQVVLWGNPPQFTAAAEAAITPGDLIEVTATGTVQRHGTAAATVLAPLFALAKTYLGLGIDDDYAAGDPVAYVAPSPGDVINARVEAAAVLTPASRLESAGDGTLQVATTGVAIAQSMETKTVGASAERTRVRIIAS